MVASGRNIATRLISLSKSLRGPTMETNPPVASCTQFGKSHSSLEHPISHASASCLSPSGPSTLGDAS